MSGDWEEGKHKRDEGGRFAEKEESGFSEQERQKYPLSIFAKAQSDELYRKALAAKGFTFDAVRGIYPTHGYAVSIHPEHERVFAAETFTKAKLKAYVEEKAAFLRANPGAHIGAWYDHEAGKWYLDVTHVESSKSEAIRLAQKHGQEGIYDLGKKETIIVKKQSERRLR